MYDVRTLYKVKLKIQPDRMSYITNLTNKFRIDFFKKSHGLEIFFIMW